jgi:two-component system response regulator YesN
MAIFIPIEAELTSGPDGQVKDQAIQIFNRVQKEIRMELRIGVSQPIESVSQLHDAYQESLLTLQLTPAGEIYYYKDLLPELAVNQKGHEDWLESSFLQAVRQADAELSSHYFNQLIQTLETGDQFNLAKTQSKMIEWLVLAARQSDKPGSNPIAALDYTPLLTCQNLDELRLRALDKIRELSVQFSGMSGRPVGDLIMQAQKYISENFAGNISLESVAEEIALSPQYFSRLFSSRAGRTFIDYLTELRINKACQLLLEGKLSIKEICSAVGYTDPNYFSRIFKKYIGLTPTEYKQNVLW